MGIFGTAVWLWGQIRQLIHRRAGHSRREVVGTLAVLAQYPHAGVEEALALVAAQQTHRLSTVTMP